MVRGLPFALVLLGLVVAALVGRAEGIEAKCSAGAIVGSKLWARLEAEQGTKELDLTHRLDSKGGRLGRKIAFRDSELRYVELLEDFCEDLPSALPLVRSEGEEPVWSVVGKGHPEEEALALDQFPQKQAKEEMKTVLGNFCFSVLDDHEDGIVGLLKQEDWAGERERQVSMGGEVKSLGARTLLDRLYEHKLDSLLERRGSELSYCVACRRLYCEELGAETFCPKAKVRVGLGGDVSAGHCPSRGLDVMTHLPALKQACHHRHLFWFFWSKLCTLRCTVCGERFAAADLKKCAYHPKKALYPPTELCGYYLCCKRDASKFDSLFGAVPARGCQHREHECDVAIMPSHVCEMVDLFRAQLTQSQAIYADLEAYDFGQAAVGNSGKDGPGEGAAEATASASGGGAPEQRALQPLVEANLRHYFAYVRNQSERSRRDEDVKLRLFGQTYQEAWQGQGEGTDRAQRGRRSILGDALQTLDCHRMKQSFITLTSRREDATVIES